MTTPAWRPGARLLVLSYLLLALILLWLQQLGGDEWLTALFWDPATRTFPLRRDPTLDFWLHDFPKPPVVALGIVTLGLLVGSFWKPALRERRKYLGYCVLTMALGAGLISLIKSGSCQSCPYDLIEYGGKNPHIRLFDAIPLGAVLGKCWPGAHAATAFSLFGYVLAVRTAGKARLAGWLLAFVIVFGIVLSLAQVARGAHFMSHQVWTAAIDWTVALVLHRLFWR
jgi:membrane-associated PAP2 superfamily phosphatase